MKKILIGILLLVVIGVVLFKKSQTHAPVIDTTQSNTNIHCALSVLSPIPNSTVSFPLEVKISVDNSNAPDCRWTVFEAQAGTLTISDINGPIPLTGFSALTTGEDWMTTSPVVYNATINPATSPVGSVTVTVHEEDVQGGGLSSQTASFTVVAQ